LAVIDLDHRLGLGKPAGVADYLVALPGLAGDAPAMRYLIARDYRLRLEGNPKLLPDEQAQAFPEHDGAELRAALQAVLDSFRAEEEAVAAQSGSWSTEVPRTAPDFRAQARAAGLPDVPGYEVLEELGRGGMGVVYKARQIGLQRIVALKMILHGAHAGLDERARFLKEAETIAGVKHANIVQVHEFGTHDGLPFFSLEFCQGGNLSSHLRGTPLPAEKAAQLVRTLAQAVHVAHQAGVIHRDLKPGNVLLDADGTPKVADFGLAKVAQLAADPEAEDDFGRTPSGAIVGTPSYMAPEQAAGKSREVGPAADVYALGAILYECLVGRPPFKAATEVETVLQVISDEPVHPRQINGRLPRDVETICLKCLHKHPARRYASAQELADDLGRFLAGEPIAARPVGAWEKGRKWARRRPAAAGLLAAVVALVLVSVVGSLALWQRSEQARRADNAEAEAREAEAEKWRKTLKEYHARADVLLGELRLLRGASGQDVVARVFGLIGDVARLRSEAEQALEEASEVAGVSPEDERNRWDERATVLRQEATRWLLAVRLDRQRIVPLPEGPEPKAIPAVALHPDLKQIAVLYPGSTTVFLVGLDGREQQRLQVPQEIARAAVTIRVEAGKRFVPGSVHTHRREQLYRFSYRGPDRLEYQLGEELLSWSLPAGKRTQEQRSWARPTSWTRTTTVGPHYLVHQDNQFSTAVMVREWDPKARPVVVWQPREARGTSHHDRLAGSSFGGDGRALFLRTNERLSLVDAAGGSSAEATLVEEGTKVSFGRSVPWPGGIALVERLSSAGKKTNPPRLVFWNATLPRTNVRALCHDDVPRSLEWSDDGLLVTGAADHRVRAWRGRHLAWVAGVPWLAEEGRTRGISGRTRVPVGNLHPQDQTFVNPIGNQWHTVQQGWRRQVSMQTEPTWEVDPTYTAPKPFAWIARGKAHAHFAFDSAWEEAVTDYSHALALGDDWQVRVLRAGVYAHLGRWRQAAADLDRAIELKAPGAAVRYERGLARFRLRRYDLALADLDEALRLDPKHLEAARLRGQVLITRDDVAGAIAGLDRVVRDDRYSASARALRGMAHLVKKDYRSALVDLDEAVRLDPDYAFAYRQRGRARFLSGDVDRAISDWTECIVLQPTNPEPYQLRAEAFLARKDHDRAIADLTEASRLDATLVAAYQRRGFAYGLRNAHAQAIADFTAAIGLEPKTASHYADRARAHMALGENDKALPDLTTAIELEPKNAELWNTRGVVNDRLKDSARALADFHQATRRNPRWVLPYANRGHLDRRLGDFDRAIVEYTRALDRDPTHPDSRIGRGHAHAERGDWTNAAADFGKAASRSSGVSMAAYFRALVLLGRGDHSGYSRACAELRARFGKRGSANDAGLVAWTEALVGGSVADVEPYRRLVAQAVVIDPRNYFFHYALGASLYRVGHLEQAVRVLREGQKHPKDGGSAFSFFLLAMSHARLGQGTEAKRCLRRAVRWIEQTYKDKPDAGDKRPLMSWDVRLQLQLLRREAEEAIANAATQRISRTGQAALARPPWLE
jgi:tetratricopeptide (TPR) repeat protein/tRNA A-37 threonylcarbamoyl transferase component Bud32